MLTIINFTSTRGNFVRLTHTNAASPDFSISDSALHIAALYCDILAMLVRYVYNAI